MNSFFKGLRQQLPIVGGTLIGIAILLIALYLLSVFVAALLVIGLVGTIVAFFKRRQAQTQNKQSNKKDEHHRIIDHDDII